MPLQQRCELYKQLEEKRKRPLIVYVTSTRRNAPAQIGADAVPEFLTQLEALPKATSAVDLMVVSDGGDGTVAWRIVSLIRERVKKLAVLVPHSAFSAATLIALGADEIVMHPHGNLGPTDVQITAPQKKAKFGAEDLAAFLRFAKEEVGLTDQGPLLELLKNFGNEVGFVTIGFTARSSQLGASLSEKLLLSHMNGGNKRQQVKAIADSFTSKFFHHAYAVGRSEAKALHLPIAEPNPEVEDLMWQIWLDIEAEMEIRSPFLPLGLVQQNPGCAPLFQPPPLVCLPGNLPPQITQGVLQQIMQSAVVPVPPTKYELNLGIIESARSASRFLVEGVILATRDPSMEIKLCLAPYKEAWVRIPVP